MVIGLLTHAQGIHRHDISMAVHECGCFSSNPTLIHEYAATRIGRCLIDVIERVLVCKVDRMKGFEFFVDEDFAGGYNASDPLNPEIVLSRTGFFAMHSGLSIY